MKIKRIILVLTIFLSAGFAKAGNDLTFDDCQQKARANYPLIHQFGLIKQSKEYSLSNISKGNLPQITLNGQATYQNEVTNFPLSIPGIDIPTFSKDQYKAVLDLTQTIWDGGAVNSQKKITEASNEVDKQSLEVDLYAIRDRVNQLFFGILTLDEQVKQLEILDKDLQNSYNMTNAMLQNGTASPSDVDAIHVELLDNDQKKTELKSSRKAYAEMLSVFIHEKITDETILNRPNDELVDPNTPISRPEITLFNRQRDYYDSQNAAITAKNMPKFSLFAEGGYGKPGLNMLSNQFDFMALGGIKLTWNFGNLYTKNNERKLLQVNKDRVNTQEETFIFNTNLQLTQTYNEVLKAKELMKKDDEIITLRNRVKSASQSKYENGVYTVNDLLKDINAESQSRQSKILHEIQYLLNVCNYKNAQGE